MRLMLPILFLLLTAQFTLAQIKEFNLTCDPADFQFIYDNYEQDIYIPATFEHNGLVWDNVSVRIRGDGSRVFPKKSLKVRFNQGEYIDGRTSLNLNAEWEDPTYIQQTLASRLMRESGQKCFTTEHVRLNLNGSFLGLYLLVEGVDTRFLEARAMDTLGATYKAALDGSSLSVFDNLQYHWEQETGEDIGMADLQQLIDDLNSAPQSDFSDFVNIHFIRDELVNMLTMNTLLSLGSTYYHNYFMYHEPSTNKWTMLPWDMDKTLLYYGSSFPYHRSSTIWMPDNPLLEKSIQSDELLAEIRQRTLNLSGSIFNVSHISPIIDSIENVIAASVEDDVTDDVANGNEWATEVSNYLNYFGQRVTNVIDQVDEYPRNFTVERIGSAAPESQITLHWTPSTSPLQRPISYRFFFGNSLDLESLASITLENITDTFVEFTAPLVEGLYYYKVQAYDGFDHVDGFDTYNPIVITNNVPALVINEINYHSSIDFDAGDWVEIHNPLSYSVDLDGWQLKDDQNDHNLVFEVGTTIAPNGFVVVSTASVSFQLHYPSVENVIGPVAFGLGNSGDAVRLYHPSGLLVDEVYFLDVAPWSTGADGLGPTLELISPELDNTLAQNWNAWADRHGTPGNDNFQELGIDNRTRGTIISVHPNPMVNESFQLIVNTDKAANASVSITDLLGKNVYQTTIDFGQGKSTVVLKPDLPTVGVYLLHVHSSSVDRTIKLIFTESNQ